jgi:bifunctional DNase/RNase
MAAIEMVISSIRVSQVSYQHYQRVAMLKEKQADRYLLIWTENSVEADAIALRLQGIILPRPSTHDCVLAILDALSTPIDYVLINKLEKETIYAMVVLHTQKGQIGFDCRPSDALALSVRTGAPIYADDSVMEKTGILLDEETGIPIFEEGEESGGKQTQINDEEIKKKMSEYYDFINTLDLQDFPNIKTKRSKFLNPKRKVSEKKTEVDPENRTGC